MLQDPGYLYGEYLFTTCVKKSRGIEDLNLHLEKLQKSCELYYGVVSLEVFFQNLISSLESEVIPENSRIRVQVSPRERREVFFASYKEKDLSFSFLISPLKEKRSEVSCKLVTGFRGAQIEHFKLPMFGESFFHKRQALLEGFDEVLYMSENGEILEASTSNILLKNEKGWFTPKRYIYKGVTRDKSIRLCHVKEKIILKDELSSFTDAVLINSVERIVKVKSIENKYFFENKMLKEISGL